MLESIIEQIKLGFDISDVEAGRKGLTNLTVAREQAERLLREYYSNQ